MRGKELDEFSPEEKQKFYEMMWIPVERFQPPVHEGLIAIVKLSEPDGNPLRHVLWGKNLPSLLLKVQLLYGPEGDITHWMPCVLPKRSWEECDGN